MWEEHLFRVHNPGDFFLEGAYNHAVGHDEREGMMEFHLFVDCLQIFILEEDSSSRVMALKGADIKYVVVEDNEGLVVGLRVGADLFHIFEF